MESLLPLRRVLIWACLAILGCGRPTDPQGTLESVRNRGLRVGCIQNQTLCSPSDNSPVGVDVTLVRKLARELHSELRMSVASESDLFFSLREGRFDLIIGGISNDAPWTKFSAFTRPYLNAHDPQRGEVQYVWALRKGENGWLHYVESFLDSQAGEAKLLLRKQK